MRDPRIVDAVRDADYEFWQVIVKHFPDIKGELSIGETIELSEAMELAVEKWLEYGMYRNEVV